MSYLLKCLHYLLYISGIFGILTGMDAITIVMHCIIFNDYIKYFGG